MRTRLGSTVRIAQACAIVPCTTSAAKSQAAAIYHGGPTNGATCGLLRNDDNAIYGAQIDGRFQDCGLIERGAATFYGCDRPNRNARVERAPFAGYHDVAGAQRRILLDVIHHHAGEISARDAPPASS